MDHTTFKDNYIWKRVQETTSLWYQCVALAKLYSSKVFNIQLSWFSWSAIEWRNTWSPFDSKRTRVNVWKTIPKQWDIIFFNKTSSNPYWHVAVVDSSTASKVLFIEQNWWKWTWTWIWTDAIRINNSDYKNVLWRFSLNQNEDKNIKQIVNASISLNSFLWDNIENEELRNLLSKTNTILRTML